MVSGDHSRRRGETPRAEVRERDGAPNAWRLAMEVSRRDPAPVGEDPDEVATSERERRAPTPVRQLPEQVGGLLIITPMILVFLLMPFALFGPPELTAKLEPIMFVLFVGSFALFFLIIGIAWFLPKKKKPENREGARPE